MKKSYVPKNTNYCSKIRGNNYNAIFAKQYDGSKIQCYILEKIHVTDRQT
jgi:hypothetical protein